MLCLLLCLWGILSAGRMGLSRALKVYAKYGGGMIAADKAVQLTPSDAEARFTRALVLGSLGQSSESISEYERAVALRPQDYYLWLVLGDAREVAGDFEGALAAYEEAARLAPFYAQPRWFLGNLLLRAGRYDEAFAELRRAGESNPALMPAIIDLAWGISRQDARTVEQFIQPQTDAARLSLARFYARHAKPSETLNLFRAMNDSLTESQRRELLNDLLAAREYGVAYQVWRSFHPEINDEGSATGPLMIDGGFEKPLSLNDPGFGWQLARNTPALKFTIDRTEPREAAQSLLVDWSGDPSLALAVVSQLVLVQPQTSYRLRFAARTGELVTGGLPLMIVNGADLEGNILGKSKPLPHGTSGWTDYVVEFKTGDETRAVLISLRREPCANGPCPIFGRLWLDDFSLQKI